MKTTALLKDWNDETIYSIITFHRYLFDDELQDVQNIINNANDFFTDNCDAFGFYHGQYQTEYVMRVLSEKYDFDIEQFDMARTLYI